MAPVNLAGNVKLLQPAKVGTRVSLLTKPAHRLPNKKVWATMSFCRYSCSSRFGEHKNPNPTRKRGTKHPSLTRRVRIVDRDAFDLK